VRLEFEALENYYRPVHVKNLTMLSIPEAATRVAMLERGEADIAYFKRSYARADLQIIITDLDPEASAAAIDARLEIQQRVARGEQGNTGE